MSSGPVFVDTWGWCALGYRADRQHENAVEFYRRLRQGSAPAFTSDYVLDEVITLLYRRASPAEATRFVEGDSRRRDAGTPQHRTGNGGSICAGLGAAEATRGQTQHLLH